ncbi:germinal-center associated nuclear protein [Culicoides brevitarsis]|uniref:germinal-center associated nuclear protein n=1 Tax=Culicoides brevitarsis TaxID=469753 RepID=UPI00307BEC5F
MDGNYIKGECEEMCPLGEVKQRIREKLVHFYEKDAKFVKEFARSAAGQRNQRSYELRTEDALMETVRYLLTEIFHDKRRPYNFMYDFVFDRLRCVRQEIVIQNLGLITTVKLLEPTIMFLAYSRYRLANESFHNFDPKICEQHLQECLKKILVCYDALPEMKYSENRCTLEALYQIFNLGSTEALSRGISLPKSVKRHPVFRLSLRIGIAYWQKNFFGTLKLMQSLPPMLFAVASLKFGQIRRQMIMTFSTAYCSKQLSVPLEWLRKVLFYGAKEETSELIEHLRHYGIECDGQAAKFEKKFDMSKAQIATVSHAFVDEKFDCDNFEIYFLLK